MDPGGGILKHVPRMELEGLKPRLLLRRHRCDCNNGGILSQQKGAQGMKIEKRTLQSRGAARGISTMPLVESGGTYRRAANERGNHHEHSARVDDVIRGTIAGRESRAGPEWQLAEGLRPLRFYTEVVVVVVVVAGRALSDPSPECGHVIPHDLQIAMFGLVYRHSI